MKLQDIYIYPIKSLGGVRLEKAEVQVKGLKYDRRWLLIDEHNKFITQRKLHHMALLKVELKEEGLEIFHKQQPQKKIFIPFELRTGKKLNVEIWEDTVEAELVGGQADSWFSDILGIACRLVLMPLKTERKLKPEYAVNDESVSFADSMPYMVIGQGSLDELNERLLEPVTMDRFRPNFVFSEGEPFEEDSWEEVQIGSCTFKITKPCARCVLITVDQQTAKKGKEPLKTLASYRMVGNKVMFGQNMLALSLGKIAIGDEVVKLR